MNSEYASKFILRIIYIDYSVYKKISTFEVHSEFQSELTEIKSQNS
jgi:hypothetical protein